MISMEKIRPRLKQIMPILMKLIVPVLILLIFLYPEYYIRKYTTVFMDNHEHFFRNALLSTLCLPVIFISLNRWIGAIAITFYTGFLLFFIKVIKQIDGIVADNVEAIMGTSCSEVSSTLADHIPACILLICILIACFCLALKLCHFRPIILSISLSCVLIPWLYHWHYTAIAWTSSNPNNDSTFNNPEGRTHMFFETYPGVPGILIYGGYKLLFYKDVPSTPHTKQDEMILSMGNDKAKNIIIVIGESATASRHSYLNPALRTPVSEQNSASAKKASTIEDVDSVTPLTNPALFRILSFRPYNRDALVELASEEGYKTYWDGKRDKKENIGSYFSLYNSLNLTLQTTPFASNLISKKRACAIEKAHSIAPLTNLAVPRILSFQSVDHPEKLYDRKNLIELASQAGYKTYWIGNQSGAGPYASRYGYISRFADVTLRPDFLKLPSKSLKNTKSEPEIIKFHDATGIKRIDDFELLKPLKAILEKDSSEHKFIILHIWGSHTGYYDKSDAIDRSALPDSDAYDRSIHHTDRLIRQVTELANKNLNQKYLLFYTSDHGEDVPRQAHGVWDGDITQYEIPMLLTWGEAETENGLKYCKRINKMRAPTGYFSQTMDKIFLSEMMGYKINPETVNLLASHDRILHVNGEIYIHPNIKTYWSSGEIVAKDISIP
ncbi:phosphoethanolamine transferase [Acetobacteraceae bacterium]|nr:phosphoethanolamine transferase [Acetobacteraceae bacterium]